MNYADLISQDPNVRSGKPCIRGMRVTVSDVLDHLANGLSHEQVIEEYPYVTEEDIRACLAFAADRERKLNARIN
ncbi:MAG TPA: DUF433 domain-containing protein [Fimbriimonadaceae bacterium]|nr:DUF433 domain-containing protein [Fimbriimonadaceae bacterium]